MTSSRMDLVLFMGMERENHEDINQTLAPTARDRRAIETELQWEGWCKDAGILSRPSLYLPDCRDCHSLIYYK